MKALFYYDQRDVRLEQIEIPEPNENQVLLKVLDVGLCQTQINEFIEGPFIINKDKHKITGKAIPLIVGHEFGGIIEKIGKNIKDDSLIGKQVEVLRMYVLIWHTMVCWVRMVDWLNTYALTKIIFYR